MRHALRRPSMVGLIIAALLLSMAYAALSITAPTSSPLAPPAASATGLIKCDKLPSGAEDNDGDVAIKTAAWDPIVYHNVDPDDPSEAQPHSHDFFGNRLPAGTNDFNSATWSMLRNFAGGSGFDATSCRIATDTASYWVPTLKCIKVSSSCDFIGQRIGVRQFSAYYRGFAGQTTHAGSIAIPAGARLVANDMTGFGLSGWTCGQNSTVTGGQNSIPDCSGSSGGPGDSLTAHLNFPSCWNNVKPNHPGDPNMLTAPNTEYGDTRDNDPTPGGYTSNDFVYPTNKTSCPASHPTEVVQLRETIAFDYTGNGTDVALSSDPTGGDGTTFHADFWNTWDQAAFEDFVQRCIRTSEEANCKP